MSERVEQRLYELLGKPTESPYGNPIPGLEALGGPPAEGFSEGVHSLSSVIGTSPDGSVITLVRLAEPIQVDPELLSQLDEGGLRPGTAISVQSVGDYVSVRVDGIDGALELPPEVAAHVFVSVSPAVG